MIRIGRRIAQASAGAVRLSVATRILIANLAMLIGIIVLFTTLIYADVSRAQLDQEVERVRAGALSLATSNPLREAMAEGADADLLSATADQFRRASGLGQVTILAAAGSDNTAEIGAMSRVEPGDALLESQPAADEVRDLPDVSRAFGGETFSDYREGESGQGLLYAASPIISESDGSVLGIVVVSQPESAVRGSLQPRLLWLFTVGGFALVLGGIATAITASGLRRVTGNYGAVELGRMLDHHQSVLQAVSEGLLLVNRHEGIVLRNAEATELLGLPPGDPNAPLPLDEAPLPESLRELLRSGRAAKDEIHYTDNHVLVVNQQSTAMLSEPGFGTADTWVVTMRDHTELQRLTGELVSVRGFSESLRSQTHEYANRLHMIVSLIETGQAEEAMAFASQELDATAEHGGTGLGGFDHPVLSALLLTKTAQAHEKGIDLEVRTEGLVEQPQGDDRDLVTIMGNLIDNALDAVTASGAAPIRQVRVMLSGCSRSGWTFEVADSGPGIPEESIDLAFTRGWSTKHPEGDDEVSGTGEQRPLSRGVGLALVVQAVRRLGGAVDARGQGEEPEDLPGAAFTVWLPGRGETEGMS